MPAMNSVSAPGSQTFYASASIIASAAVSVSVTAVTTSDGDSGIALESTAPDVAARETPEQRRVDDDGDVEMLDVSADENRQLGQQQEARAWIRRIGIEFGELGLNEEQIAFFEWAALLWSTGGGPRST
jgi:hypothetical protein